MRHARHASIALLASTFVLSASRGALAETAVSGAVSGAWTKAAGPYIVGVTGGRIETGATLTIEAGTEVRFTAHTPFTVEGTLVARGTADQPILFTRTPDNAATRWWGIRFDHAFAAESVLSHCIVEYGLADAAGTSAFGRGGGIYASESNVRVESCTIRHNEAHVGGGIYVAGRKPVVVRDSRIHDNVATSSTYNACGGGGLYVHDGSNAEIQNNLVYGNSYSGNDANFEGGGGVMLMSDVRAFTNNTVFGNVAPKGSGVHVVGDVAELRPVRPDPDARWHNPDKVRAKRQLKIALEALAAMTREAARRPDPERLRRVGDHARRDQHEQHREQGDRREVGPDLVQADHQALAIEDRGKEEHQHHVGRQ